MQRRNLLAQVLINLINNAAQAIANTECLKIIGISSEMIRKSTESLPEKYRGVFVLSDVEGLSNEETAKILGLTVPAVKSRLHRARLYLREELSRYLREGKSH